MFQNCSLLTNFDVSNWDVSNVTNMSRLFQGCVAMTTINCDNWDVGNVESFERTFHQLNIVTLNLSSWDVSSATDMQIMFGTSNLLTSIGDISSWDVGNVTNMSSTFACKLLQSVNDTGNWDVSSVVNMSNMFDSNDEINISLANWTITQVKNFYRFMRWADGLSTANYDATLISWASQTPSLNEVPNFGGSTYTLGGAAETARNTLINTYGWTITDGGGV
jgi:surface protein